MLALTSRSVHMQYLLRMEQLALHIPGAPEIFVGCAQLKITNGGTGKPKMVSIPGYIAADGMTCLRNALLFQI